MDKMNDIKTNVYKKYTFAILNEFILDKKDDKNVFRFRI